MSPSLISILLPTGEVLASRALTADSILSRMVGLLGHESLGADEALILPGCRSIHTWFMRFTIDVVFVDRDWRVVALVGQMPPWRLSPMVWRASAVIELAAGTVSRAHLLVGDRLQVQPRFRA